MPGKLVACLTLAVAASLLTGCSPAQRLVGTWQIDSQQAKANLGANNPLGAMAGVLLGALDYQMEFRGDGTVTVTSSMAGNHNGAWRYVKTDGNDLVLMVRTGKETSESEWRVRIIDNDHVEVGSPFSAGLGMGNQRMPLMRIKKT